MVALRHLEIPYHEGISRQRGAEFGAHAQGIDIVPAEKRVGVKLMEFVAPEIPEKLSGWKSLKIAANSVGKQTSKKSWASGSKQRRIIPTISSTTANRSFR